MSAPTILVKPAEPSDECKSHPDTKEEIYDENQQNLFDQLREKIQGIQLLSLFFSDFFPEVSKEEIEKVLSEMKTPEYKIKYLDGSLKPNKFTKNVFVRELLSLFYKHADKEVLLYVLKGEVPVFLFFFFLIYFS